MITTGAAMLKVTAGLVPIPIDALMYTAMHATGAFDRNPYIGFRRSAACSRRKGMATEAVVFDCLHG